MNRFSVALVGALTVSAVMTAIATPALALGGCGPNRHRTPWGYCAWGGQNQSWCLRRTGHRAVRLPNGVVRCF